MYVKRPVGRWSGKGLQCDKTQENRERLRIRLPVCEMPQTADVLRNAARTRAFLSRLLFQSYVSCESTAVWGLWGGVLETHVNKTGGGDRHTAPAVMYEYQCPLSHTDTHTHKEFISLQWDGDKSAARFFSLIVCLHPDFAGGRRNVYVHVFFFVHSRDFNKSFSRCFVSKAADAEFI